MKNKTNLGKKYNEFLSNNESVKIKLEDIFLTEDVHINSKCSFSDRVNKLKANDVTEINNVATIRELESGYALVQGYAAYVIAKELGCKYLNCIVVKCKDRNDFIKRYMLGKRPKRVKKEQMNVSIDDIIITSAFASTIPSATKFQDKLNKYLETGKLKPIKVTKKNVLVDGYISYLIAKELGLTEVIVKVM